MAASPKLRRKRGRGKLMAFVDFILRVVNLLVALLLAFIASNQTDRPDAFIWVLLFTVPAVLTFILAVRPRTIDRVELRAVSSLCVDRVELRAVSSLCVGCCLALLIFLGVSLLRAKSKESTLVMLNDQQHFSSSNPLNYKQTWEMVAVVMVIAWLKFLAMTTSDSLRESGVAKVEASSVRMLWALVLVMISFVVMFFISYVFSLLPFSTHYNHHNIMTSADIPIKAQLPATHAV
ncbi:hypothetical protein Pcinc_015894 [Petrolisthes cinctipes]|uniref:Uncharacterized protein n=1 Tax=Petrolisthes cinctipes TaxID=88211 RepID=A0AAE1FTW1_PETCI|nr:hypothetical protein Pcinc_015894 [Petrolisthes cinctipes]